MPRTSVISAFINDNASGAVGPDGTQYYVELTIQSSQISSTLTNFPVYVDLSNMPAAFFTNVQSDGGDIRVTESDGLTRCPVDLVSIDTGASTGELHFLASSLSSSSDTTYRIYYDAGGGLSQPGVATTYGRNAVWADYEVVYHGDNTTDSTGNGNTLTASGAGATSGNAAKVGDGFELDGTDAFTASDAALLTPSGDHSVQAWLRLDVDSSFFGIIGKFDYGNSNREWMMQYNATDNQMRYNFSSDGTATSGIEGSTVLSAATWYHVHATADVSAGGNGITLYLNGAGETPTVRNNNSTTVYDGTADLAVGALLNSGTLAQVFDGTLDELRMKNGILSADWVAAEYTNQNTPTTFYTVGSQTAV